MHDIYQAPPPTHTHTNASVSIISCAIGLRMLSYIYFQVDHLPDLIPCSCSQPNSYHPWLYKGTLHHPFVGKQDTNAKTIMHWNHRLSPLYWGERTCWCLWVMRAASTPALLYISQFFQTAGYTLTAVSSPALEMSWWPQWVPTAQSPVSSLAVALPSLRLRGLLGYRVQ